MSSAAMKRGMTAGNSKNILLSQHRNMHLAFRQMCRPWTSPPRITYANTRWSRDLSATLSNIANASAHLSWPAAVGSLEAPFHGFYIAQRDTARPSRKSTGRACESLDIRDRALLV